MKGPYVSHGLNSSLPFIYSCLVLCFLATQESSAALSKEQERFEKIIKTYTFVGDFSPKPELRKISDALMWKYPIKPPKIVFPVDHTLGQVGEVESTSGSGRAYEHLNRGLVYFENGDNQQAKKTWLSARAKWGKTYKHHRRTDYFIGLSFLRTAEKQDHLTAEDPISLRPPTRLSYVDRARLARKRTSVSPGAAFELKLSYSNAATFLSWAFIVKKDLKDPLLEKVTPKALLVLAQIYFRYERYAAAYSATMEALNFLRKTGRTDQRPQLRLLLVELLLKNQDELAAVRELDTLIRQDPEPMLSAYAFSRVGDVYFGLNNYELADDVYALSAKIDESVYTRLPESLILRGESLFWMGDFSNSERILTLGGQVLSRTPLDRKNYREMQQWASLRLADISLVRSYKESRGSERRKKWVDQAKLRYFRNSQSFPGSEVARISDLRRLCIEIDEHEGHNISHAQRKLHEIRENSSNPAVLELAWFCQLRTMARVEKTTKLLEKISPFVKTYPKSKYTQNLISSVKEVRRSHLDEYLDKGDHHSAILYYENYRDELFKSLKDEQKLGLFLAYVETMQSKKAEPFWQSYKEAATRRKNLGVKSPLVEAVYLSELYAPEKSGMRKEIAANISALKSSKAAFKMSVNHKYYLDRIRNSRASRFYYPWIYQVVRANDLRNKKGPCDDTYSTLSAWSSVSEKSRRIKRDLWKEVTSVTNKNLESLLRDREECAHSYISLEERVGKSYETEYASLWLKRLDFPMGQVVVRSFWNAADILSQKGRRGDARAIWELLSEKAPEGSIEKKMAGMMLSPLETENEKLWSSER